jgi:hypothetical protein
VAIEVEFITDSTRARFPIDVLRFVEAQRQRTLESWNRMDPDDINRTRASADTFETIQKSVPPAARPSFRCGCRPRTSQKLFVTAADGEATRLWVQGDFGNYRDGAKQLLIYLGAQEDIINGFDVDHVAAKKGVRSSDLIELALVPSLVNSGWGSVIETLEANRMKSPRYEPKSMAGLTHGRVAKILGVAPPNVPLRSQEWCELLADDLRRNGVTIERAGLVDSIARWRDAMIYLGRNP